MSPGRERRERAFGLVKTVLLAGCIALFVRVGIAQAYEVDGPSMEPTLLQGERLFVARAAYGLSLPFLDEALLSWSLPSAGDVVVVQSPADGLDLVKRVVGLPGDRIAIRGSTVLRNGVAIDTNDLGLCDPSRHRERQRGCHLYRERLGDRSWVISRSDDELGEDQEEIVVPPSHIYVLGDHRDRSNDSRYLGPIPASRLRGRVLFSN